MATGWSRSQIFAKGTVAFAALFVLSAGTCGLQISLERSGNAGLIRFMDGAGVLAIYGMAFAVVGLAIWLAIWAVVAIFVRK